MGLSMEKRPSVDGLSTKQRLSVNGIKRPERDEQLVKEDEGDDGNEEMKRKRKKGGTTRRLKTPKLSQAPQARTAVWPPFPSSYSLAIMTLGPRRLACTPLKPLPTDVWPTSLAGLALVQTSTRLDRQKR